MANEAAATNTPSPATGGGVSAFRSARMDGNLGSVAAPTPAAPAANDNAQPASTRQPMVAPGDDASVLEQLSQDDDEGIPGLEEAAELADPAEETPQADPLDDVIAEAEGGKQIKARDVLEALKNGQLPAEVMDKVGWEIDVNGVKQVVTASEMASGYMRQRDYTQKTQQVQAQRRENEAFQERFDERCGEAAADPSGDKLRKMMRRMGLGQALYNAAVAIATEEEQVSRMTPEARDYYRKMKALEEERETLREQAAMREETAADRKRSQAQQRFQREYDALTPTALARVGLKGTAPEVREYQAALRVILREPGRKLDLDACVQAARTARETIEDYAREHAAAVAKAAPPTSPAAAALAQSRQQQQQAPSVRRAAPAPLTGGQALPTAGTGGTPRDFRKHLGRMNGR